MDDESSRPILVSFVGGSSGEWRVDHIKTVIGDGLRPVERVQVIEGSELAPPLAAGWTLRGVTSNLRYTNASERAEFARRHNRSGVPRPLGQR